MHTCKVKLGHDLDATYQVQYMEYEIDTTIRKGKTTNFKTKSIQFNITNTFCTKIFFPENSSNFLFLGKPGS